MSSPSHLILINQFGEESINVLEGSGLPIGPGASNIIAFTGATTPVNGGSGTGVGIAAKGSLYVAIDTGALYYNSGSITSPTWSAIGSGTTATLLTGFVAGAGTVSATDSVLQGFDKLVGNQNNLQNATFTLQSETISGAGALSTTKAVSLVNNATGSSYAVTLAAPSSQDGQLKIVKLGTATHGATLACTNITFSGAYTPAGTTTLTFTNTGDSVILMAVGAKWNYLGGSAVAS